MASGLLYEAAQALALAERAKAQRLMRHHGGALADFNRAIEIDPKLTWAIASRGETYRAMNRHPDALMDFDRVSARAPGLA